MDMSVENYIGFLNDYDEDDSVFDEASEGIKDVVGKVDGGLKKIPLIGRVYGLISKLFGAIISAFRGLIDKIRKKKKPKEGSNATTIKKPPVPKATPQQIAAAKRDTTKLAKAAAVNDQAPKKVVKICNEVATKVLTQLNGLKTELKSIMAGRFSVSGKATALKESALASVKRVDALATTVRDCGTGPFAVSQNVFAFFEKVAAKVTKEAESFKTEVDRLIAASNSRVFATKSTKQALSGLAATIRSLGTALNKFAVAISVFVSHCTP